MDDDKLSYEKNIELWVPKIEVWFCHWLSMGLWIIYSILSLSCLSWNMRSRSQSSGTHKVVSLQPDAEVFIQQFWKKEKMSTSSGSNSQAFL